MAEKIQHIESITTEVVFSQEDIQRKIYTIRGVQVMLDRDLAILFQIETKALNQAVKRNARRFPERYMFQLTKDEANALRSQIVTTKISRGGSRYLPYAFTEQGISQLSSVLNSNVAIEMSIRIIDAFVAMRRFLTANAGILQRLGDVEKHQLETDQKIDQVLDCLEAGTLKEKAHIFSAGQIYEAKSFITDLIGKATKRIDNMIGGLSLMKSYGIAEHPSEMPEFVRLGLTRLDLM